MIPLWAIKLLAGLLAVAGIWFHGYHHGQAREQRKTAAAVQAAEANARAITARRAQSLQEATDAEFLARQAAQRDAAASRAAVVGLRRQAADFAASSLPTDPTAAARCTAADDRARVLADLLGELAERADGLAGALDSSRIAGRLCEQAYDNLAR